MGEDTIHLSLLPKGRHSAGLPVFPVSCSQPPMEAGTADIPIVWRRKPRLRGLRGRWPGRTAAEQPGLDSDSGQPVAERFSVGTFSVGTVAGWCC